MMSGFGIIMIFTNSGRQTQAQTQSREIQVQAQARQVQAQSREVQVQAQARQVQAQAQVQARAMPRGMPQVGMRTMDLGNLNNSKSCGSCGH